MSFGKYLGSLLICFFVWLPLANAQEDCQKLKEGFDFPYRFKNEDVVLDITCSKSDSQLKIESEQKNQLVVIAKTGYLVSESNIQALQLRGKKIVEEWNIGSATAPFATSLLQSEKIVALVFTCTYDTNAKAWNCGCTDGNCEKPQWSLQVIKQKSPEIIPPAAIGKLRSIKLPAGFGIHYFAENVINARSLARGKQGTIFVGNRDGGTVYALVDRDGDYVADEKYTLASGLDQPNGVEFVDGDLYVAEIGRIIKFENIEENLQNPPEPKIIFADLPNDRSHGWKYLAKGPDNRLYFGIGAPCNACASKNKIYATLASINLDGSDFQIFAEGIRNTVGFDWHPQTKELWFTENGRDQMGDNIPTDELNSAPVSGLHFGFPICHQGDILDPEFGENEQRSCAEFTPPKIKLGPHVAALGMKFYTGEMFPEEYRGDIFIAEHGSWNRTNKIGYQISHANIDDNEATSYEPFATGWLQGEQAWGRPVDVLELPDGSLLVSDDFHNAVYRIYYKGL